MFTVNHAALHWQLCVMGFAVGPCFQCVRACSLLHGVVFANKCYEFAVGPRLCPHVALHSRCALQIVQCVWVSDTTATLHQQIGATCLQCVRGCKLHHCLAFANRCYELWSGSVFCVPYAALPSQLKDTSLASLSRFPNHCSIAPANRC